MIFNRPWPWSTCCSRMPAACGCSTGDALSPGCQSVVDSTNASDSEGRRASDIDFKSLWKPPIFHGDSSKWRDFSLIFSAHVCANGPKLESYMSCWSPETRHWRLPWHHVFTAHVQGLAVIHVGECDWSTRLLDENVVPNLVQFTHNLLVLVSSLCINLKCLDFSTCAMQNGSRLWSKNRWQLNKTWTPKHVFRLPKGIFDCANGCSAPW